MVHKAMPLHLETIGWIVLDQPASAETPRGLPLAFCYADPVDVSDEVTDSTRDIVCRFRCLAEFATSGGNPVHLHMSCIDMRPFGRPGSPWPIPEWLAGSILTPLSLRARMEGKIYNRPANLQEYFPYFTGQIAGAAVEGAPARDPGRPMAIA
jgi:hypothetical protein